MKALFIFLFALSSLVFAQTEITEKVPPIPTDQNFKQASLGVLYDASGNKYYQSTDLMTSGFYGGTFIDSTQTVTGHFFAFQVYEDAVIDTVVATGLTGDMHGTSLSSGFLSLIHDITRFKLTSGKVLLYKSE